VAINGSVALNHMMATREVTRVSVLGKSNR